MAAATDPLATHVFPRFLRQIVVRPCAKIHSKSSQRLDVQTIPCPIRAQDPCPIRCFGSGMTSARVENRSDCCCRLKIDQQNGVVPTGN